MKTELVNVSPAMARDMLKHNTSNRALRPAAVESFRVAYERGEWKLTHQGIAFSPAGRLLDGQHRLTFISSLPESASIPIYVTTGMDEDVFDAIDQGNHRNVADVLGISSTHSAVGRYFAKLVNPYSGTGLSPQFVEPFVEWSAPELDRILMFSPAKKKMWSSAPVLSAAIVQMKRSHDEDFVLISYHSLITADTYSMPHGARALMQQYMNGKLASARGLDLFCRALRAFDSSKNIKVRSINVMDQSAVLKTSRDFIAADMKKSPAKAGLMVAKPVADSKPKRRLAAA